VHGSINQLAAALRAWRITVEGIRSLEELFPQEQLTILGAVRAALLADPKAFEGESHVTPAADE
jgi:hypothetical protein